MKKTILLHVILLVCVVIFGGTCFALTQEEREAYSSVVDRILHEPYGEYATYAEVDLNNDGAPELLVSHLSDDEISTIDEVFTILDGNCVSVGFVFGPNSYYETETGEGIYAVNAYQGYGTKDKVCMIDNKLSTSYVLEGEIVDWNIFTNDNPIFQNKLVNYYNEQIIPGSDARFLSEEDIEFLGDTGLELAKNEIYARHGRVFVTPYINKYFRKQSWYSPTVPPEEFSDSVFNEFENSNITLMVDEESRRNQDVNLSLRNLSNDKLKEMAIEYYERGSEVIIPITYAAVDEVDGMVRISLGKMKSYVMEPEIFAVYEVNRAGIGSNILTGEYVDLTNVMMSG